jgi:hypothetical protein
MMLCRTVVITSFIQRFSLELYSKFQLVAAGRRQFAGGDVGGGGGAPMQNFRQRQRLLKLGGCGVAGAASGSIGEQNTAYKVAAQSRALPSNDDSNNIQM